MKGVLYTGLISELGRASILRRSLRFTSLCPVFHYRGGIAVSRNRPGGILHRQPKGGLRITMYTIVASHLE